MHPQAGRARVSGLFRHRRILDEGGRVGVDNVHGDHAGAAGTARL